MTAFHTYDAPWGGVSTTPWRGYKNDCYEGGLATPGIFYWPRGLRARGTITHEVVHVIDIMPTCLELAGAGYPDELNGQRVTPVEGKSLVPIFEGRRRSGHEYVYWEWSGRRAVRHGDWKLVWPRGGQWELYDLKTDRIEQRNVAAAQPAIVQNLAAQWQAWARRVGADKPKLE